MELRSAPRTVQDYIDLRPEWPDGTPFGSAPMTQMQWLIWSLAAAGKFFEGLVVFMTGIALPLIARQFHITAAQGGIVSAATLMGILIGAVGLGGLSDVFGRKRMFVVEMVIFMVFLIGITVVSGFWPLVICLFGIGLALGCDYPTAHMIISESTPSVKRPEQLVIGAFAFQAVGALAGTGLGWLVLQRDPALDAWHWMFATALIPGLIVTVWRFYITESASWLFVRGELTRAQTAASRLLERRPQYPKEVKLGGAAGENGHAAEKMNFGALFKPQNRRATILASVPVVSARPQHVRHRHLHADAPGRGVRRRTGPFPQHERHHRARRACGQGQRAHHLDAARGHHVRGAVGRPARAHQTAGVRFHRMRRPACSSRRSRPMPAARRRSS